MADDKSEQPSREIVSAQLDIAKAEWAARTASSAPEPGVAGSSGSVADGGAVLPAAATAAGRGAKRARGKAAPHEMPSPKHRRLPDSDVGRVPARPRAVVSTSEAIPPPAGDDAEDLGGVAVGAGDRGRGRGGGRRGRGRGQADGSADGPGRGRGGGRGRGRGRSRVEGMQHSVSHRAVY